MNGKRSANMSVPKGSSIAKSAKVAAILVGVLVMWIVPSSGGRGVPLRAGRVIAAEPASHVLAEATFLAANPELTAARGYAGETTKSAALARSTAASAARYSAMAASYFASSPELRLARSYYQGLNMPSAMARSAAASSARWSAMAMSYSASNPELSMYRSFKLSR